MVYRKMSLNTIVDSRKRDKKVGSNIITKFGTDICSTFAHTYPVHLYKHKLQGSDYYFIAKV